MLLTNHTLTGLVLSQAITNPVALAPVALGSHLFLDSLPHHADPRWPFKSRPWLIMATIDNLVALAVFGAALAVWPERWLQIVVGVFFAALPDLLFLFDIFLHRPINNRFTRFHSRVQWQLPAGAVVEVGWAAAMVWLLYSVYA